jgi:hypothetical protein
MKIIMFHQNTRNDSAIIQSTSLATTTNKNRLVANEFLANGYEDRFLWEEAASLRPKKPERNYLSDNWQ